MHQLQQAELEVEALLLPVAELVEGAEHRLQKARQLFLTKQRGGARGAALFFGRNLQQLGLAALGFVPAPQPWR